MSVTLGPDLRPTVWNTLDWSSAAPEFGDSVLANESIEPTLKAEILCEIAELCEFCVLDPQSAASLYSAAYQADRTKLALLERMRELCHRMGRTDHAARIAELQFRHTQEARFHAIAGQSWLDANEPDRALKPLLLAAALAPDNPHLLAALQVARRDWANPEKHADELLAESRNNTDKSPIQGLQAARIFNMLDIADERYEEALNQCLNTSPNLPSACHLMERLLFTSERWQDLAAHFERRCGAAPNEEMAVGLQLQGSSMLFRAGAGVEAAPLLVSALNKAAKAHLPSIPGLLAQLRALVASRSEKRKDAVELAELVYSCLESVDEQVGIAIFCAQISWHAQKDKETAGWWTDRLSEHCEDHRLVTEFDQS
jgi:hypothetical protein